MFEDFSYSGASLLGCYLGIYCVYLVPGLEPSLLPIHILKILLHNGLPIPLASREELRGSGITFRTGRAGVRFPTLPKIHKVCGEELLVKSAGVRTGKKAGFTSTYTLFCGGNSVLP